ncbi:MAG: ferric reductase-like transmembrane domain-containing protein, partial [Clostridia bacterium]|nr:ferric reductase-like transmembrane domain-containing protein [Clostridia bacterium]
MVICQSLALAALIVWLGRDFIKRRPGVCYGLASALALLSVSGLWSGAFGEWPAWCARFVIPIFTKGALAMSLFFFVMFANAVPNGSAFMKRVMPIRGELSIIASILAIGHGVALGKAQLLHALEGKLDGAAGALAFIVSLALLAVLLPLFVTSFKKIRRRMNPKAWKRLQRFAYGFYGLAFLHILLFNCRAARGGNTGAAVNVLAYGALFLTYAVMRGRKALEKKRPDRSNGREALAALGALALAGLVALVYLPAPAPVLEPDR